MNLWTEYEGRTIDGTYPLTKLIEPEGRSAFFSTSNGTGKPTVIRLIESHFDGDQILSRWRGVEALNHPNLVKLKSFGHVVVDETSLVYAVMEPGDANLGEMLKERRLTEAETRQLATSLLAAIQALHSNGFVHEHVVPENVLAVGETIKLRSDCIREALEGEEGAELKRKDVRDFATVLLAALTQQRKLENSTRYPALPAPFEEIVRKGMSGEWGLAQIGVALKPAAGAGAQSAARPAAGREGAAERPTAPAPPVAARSAGPAASSAAVTQAQGDGSTPGIAPSVSRRIRVPIDEESRRIGPRGIAYGVGTLLIVLLGWYFVHSRSNGASEPARRTSAASAGVAPESTPVAEKNPAAAVARSSHSGPAAPVAANTSSSGEQSSGRWRVVAFTYNRQDQARQKAAEIAQRRPDLSPNVFTPNGRAPFLVTLGGEMSKQDAFAFSGKAKREGMPRDTYAQNYRGSGN